MPIVGWIIFVGLAVVVMLSSAVFGEALDHIGFGCVVGAFICIIIIIVMIWYFNSTATGRRAFKSQESNFNNGIERIVKVYDVNGKLITEYDGKFDITYNDDRILFDDENGKRHVIYYPTGTVTVDEK